MKQMTRQQIQNELKSEFLALAFCKTEYQTQLVEENIAKLMKMMEEAGA